MAKNSAKLVINKLSQVKINIAHLSNNELLVGIPEDNAERKDEESEMNNATLGYIHNYGSPANNIPARPFMEPGIKNAKETISKFLKVGAQKTLTMSGEQIDKYLGKAGQAAVSSIKSIITAGISPQIKWASVKSRLRRKEGVAGAKKALKRGGIEPSMADVKPLVATGQLRNAITYVLSKKK